MVRPNDADGLERFIATFYEGFDNRAGLRPVEGRLRGMFTPTAVITKVEGELIRRWTRDEFIEPRLKMLTDGTLADFHEWETDARTIMETSAAQRWSRYEKQGTLNGTTFRGTGHKFIQLRRDDGVWRINVLLWEDL